MLWKMYLILRLQVWRHFGYLFVKFQKVNGILEGEAACEKNLFFLGNSLLPYFFPSKHRFVQRHSKEASAQIEQWSQPTSDMECWLVNGDPFFLMKYEITNPYISHVVFHPNQPEFWLSIYVPHFESPQNGGISIHPTGSVRRTSTLVATFCSENLVEGKLPHGSKDPLLGMHLGYNLGAKVSF